MADSEETKKCPYCSELILSTAKKCKHCGEWLEEINERKGTDWKEKGSVDARAVTRGLKQKEQDDFNQGCAGGLTLIVAIVIGIGASNLFSSSGAGWIIGGIIFIAGLVWIAKSYFEE